MSADAETDTNDDPTTGEYDEGDEVLYMVHEKSGSTAPATITEIRPGEYGVDMDNGPLFIDQERVIGLRSEVDERPTFTEPVLHIHAEEAYRRGDLG
jgi:hypothetical protein